MKCVVEISPSAYVSYLLVDLIGGNRRLNPACMRTFAKKKEFLFLSIDISVNLLSWTMDYYHITYKSPKTQYLRTDVALLTSEYV